MGVFNYTKNEDFKIDVLEKTFLNVLGTGINEFINDLTSLSNKKYLTVFDVPCDDKNKDFYYRKVGLVINTNMDNFVGETVRDEIAFGMESLAKTRNEIMEVISSFSNMYKIEDIMDKDPNSLGTSDKVKIKIISALVCQPKILVINNCLEELDVQDLNIVIKNLKEFVSKGNAIINVTNNVEETLFGDKIIVIDENQILIEGETISVLNEEKLMKRLGLGLPFTIDLSRQLMDYDVIKKYYFKIEEMVEEIWK